MQCALFFEHFRVQTQNQPVHFSCGWPQHGLPDQLCNQTQRVTFRAPHGQDGAAIKVSVRITAGMSIPINQTPLRQQSTRIFRRIYPTTGNDGGCEIKNDRSVIATRHSKRIGVGWQNRPTAAIRRNLTPVMSAPAANTYRQATGVRTAFDIGANAPRMPAMPYRNSNQP